MFENPTRVGLSQRVVATLVACAVLLGSVGVYTTAQAANLTFISNTLSDSDLGALSSHTIAFTIPAGSALAATSTVTVEFPVEFLDVANVTAGDVTVTVAGGAETPTSFVAGATSISFDGVAAAAEEEVVVAIADGIITNPSVTDSYEFTVDTGASGDIGKTRVAIIDNVLVTAVVETSFDFTISGVASSTAINGTSTTGTTSATEIPFGVLSAGEIKSLGQRLNVATNARNGFVVTIEADSDLESSTGAIIDNFIGTGEITGPGTAWVPPANTVTDERTWGHWGITSDDDLAVPFGANEFMGVSSTTPREVFTHDGPSDGTTDNIGQADVLYQIEITALQEAGDDYNTTLTYIATPTF